MSYLHRKRAIQGQPGNSGKLIFCFANRTNRCELFLTLGPVLQKRGVLQTLGRPSPLPHTLQPSSLLGDICAFFFSHTGFRDETGSATACVWVGGTDLRVEFVSLVTWLSFKYVQQVKDSLIITLILKNKSLVHEKEL